jgi:ATP-dependent DNA helicase DinG
MAAPNRPFEARAEHLEMAQSIAGAIRDETHLLVEAGTGTGKSYAYLVPFLLWAIENKKRVLIATGTKALQQQLVERDLPFLRDMFGRHFGTDIKFALCLGTGNYVCPRRLAKAQVAGLFASESEVKQLADIQKFAGKSPLGEISICPSSRFQASGANSIANRICVWGATVRSMTSRFITVRAANRKRHIF